MEPEALEEFIPKIGNRLAILDYCTREMGFRNKRKGSLLEKLRSELKNKKEGANLHPVAAGKNKPAMKMTRMVDIGWLNFENGRLIQVRAKQGGGTRKVSLERNSNKKDILTIEKNVFFVDEITGEITVAEMFKITGFSNLRFYIRSCRKEKESTMVTNHASLEQMEDNTSKNESFIEEPANSETQQQEEKGTQLITTETIVLNNSFYEFHEIDNEIPPNDTSNINFDSIIDDDNEVPKIDDVQDDTAAVVILHRGNMLQELIDQFIPLHVKSKLQLEKYICRMVIKKKLKTQEASHVTSCQSSGRGS
ncbi:hypothetical protein JTB14_020050 [Gonioctena quinquepunctata]|nr:hypothetical protein JTB14_020050 [Gonioctena quinquepunctata]